MQQCEFRSIEPDITAVWLALRLYIWDVLSSDLGLESGFPELGFLFSSVPVGKSRHSAFNYASTSSFQIISDSLFINDIIRCMVWTVNRVVK
jgi:hypothetical protein